jgi:amino acid adenylation domain-containing protein/thioester reductase-like protein
MSPASAIQGFRCSGPQCPTAREQLAADLASAVAQSDEVRLFEANLADSHLALSAFACAVGALVIGRFLHQDEVVMGLARPGTQPAFIPLATSPTTTWRTITEGVLGQLRFGNSQPAKDHESVHAVVIESSGEDHCEVMTDCISGEFYIRIANASRPTVELHYESSLDHALMQQVLDSLVEAMRSIANADASSLTVADVSLVSKELRAQLVEKCRGATRDYPDGWTTRDLIEDTTKSAPDTPAVIFGGRCLTYRQLDSKANALAMLLQKEGIGENDVLGMLIENSLELPIAILAALKLGAIFIPLDDRWPADRLTTIVTAAKPSAVVALPNAQSLDGVKTITVDEGRLVSMGDFACCALTPADLAYGFPTSGSSGIPKCALNVHRGLLNRFLYMTQRYGRDGGSVTLQNSKHVFDSSLWQLLWPLTTGGCVVIPPAVQRLDLDMTIDLIERYRVTMTDFVPSVFNILVEHLERNRGDVERIASLENLLIGGEEISAFYCQRFNTLLPHVNLTNTYGPTEAAIGMVFHAVSPADGDRIPIGRPIDNTFAIVLDEQRRLMPPGALGELYIGGDCLGVGYLNDPERTRAAWVDNPFDELPGEHLYRTGDLVYEQPDGLLYFVGREDTQVKIGGVRIELSEIEHTLRKFTGVKEVAVCVTGGVTGKRLVAYIATEQDLSMSDLRAFLTQRLPRQFIPSRFVLLDALPLTHNGKVDRKYLETLDEQVEEPASDGGIHEARLLEMWRQILNEPGSLTRDDDFFEFGGDSLLAYHLLGEVEQAFGVKLTLKAFYAGPTVRQLGEAIARGGRGSQPDTHGHPMRAASDLTLIDGLVPGGMSVEAEPNCVLVTGASGFIGVHVVNELLRRSNVRLLCLMRDGDTSAAQERLQRKLEQFKLWQSDFETRMEIVRGDVEVERLGVPSDVWSDLESDVDAVVHCAGVVDLLHDYEYHRRVNVLGTADLIRLATKGRGKAMHQLSSADGIMLDREHKPLELSQGAPAEGYTLSKWVAEQLLLNARLRGANVTVYRIGEAMPRAHAGIPNGSSLVYLLLKTCLLVGEYPEALVRLDYTPVDCISRIVGDSVLDGTYRGRSLSVYHPCGTTLDWVMNVFRSLGSDVRPTSAGKFVELLEAGISDSREISAFLCVVRAAIESRNREWDSPDVVLKGLFTAPVDSLGSPVHSGQPGFWPRVDHSLLGQVLHQIRVEHASCQDFGEPPMEAHNGRLQAAAVGNGQA